MKFRFRLRECLGVMLIVALVLALIGNHQRHQREVKKLREIIDGSRSTLRIIEYGKANLQLLELNPAVWNDRDCSSFLKHELAVAILQHWRNKDAIDAAVGGSEYAANFAGDALAWLQCTSVEDFETHAKSEWSIYPDDELWHAVRQLSASDFEAFDEFIQTAISAEGIDSH